VSMVFTDANGTRWLRDSNWKLSQVADPLEEAGSMPRVGCGVLWHGPPGQRPEPARLSRGPAHG
jgi:hypothetical protein